MPIVPTTNKPSDINLCEYCGEFSGKKKTCQYCTTAEKRKKNQEEQLKIGEGHDLTTKIPN